MCWVETVRKGPEERKRESPASTHVTKPARGRTIHEWDCTRCYIHMYVCACHQLRETEGRMSYALAWEVTPFYLSAVAIGIDSRYMHMCVYIYIYVYVHAYVRVSINVGMCTHVCGYKCEDITPTMFLREGARASRHRCLSLLLVFVYMRIGSSIIIKGERARARVRKVAMAPLIRNRARLVTYLNGILSSRTLGNRRLIRRTWMGGLLAFASPLMLGMPTKPINERTKRAHAHRNRHNTRLISSQLSVHRYN